MTNTELRKGDLVEWTDQGLKDRGTITGLTFNPATQQERVSIGSWSIPTKNVTRIIRKA